MEKVLSELREIDIAKLASDMVKIPSYSGMENQEDEISRYILAFFENEGIDAYRYEIEHGRYNVVAVLHGNGGKSLMLNGHIDTVPAYDFEDAFSGKIEDGYLLGRGSMDMKSQVAAMMAVLAAINRSGVNLKGDLVFTGVSDEEERGIGAISIVKKGIKTDAAIIGESTEMKLKTGQKGLEWIKASFKGIKVHGGAQEKGVNAIAGAARFIDKVNVEYAHRLKDRKDEFLGDPTVNIGTIVGGDQPSTVADSCTVTLDRRRVLTETYDMVYDELRDIAEVVTDEMPGLEITISDIFEVITEEHAPFVTSPESEIVSVARNILRQHGLSDGTSPISAWTDAGFIANGTGTDCVILGPGKLEVAHSVNERISIEELNVGAEIYAKIALEFCGTV